LRAFFSPLVLSARRTVFGKEEFYFCPAKPLFATLSWCSPDPIKAVGAVLPHTFLSPPAFPPHDLRSFLSVAHFPLRRLFTKSGRDNLRKRLQKIVLSQFTVPFTTDPCPLRISLKCPSVSQWSFLFVSQAPWTLLPPAFVASAAPSFQKVLSGRSSSEN